MKYTVEQDLADFKAWSGGKDTWNDLEKADKLEQAQEYIEMLFADREELPSETEINDILWFERQSIYEHCGLDENGEEVEEDEE